MSSEQPTSPYTFDHVPSLKELLPKTAGVPGVKYMQVCSINAKPAQDEGWGPVEGAKMFTIEGPGGYSHMALACKGTPVPGASDKDGARIMNLDRDIYRLTKIWLGKLPKELCKEFNVSEYWQEDHAPAAPNSQVTSEGDNPSSLADSISEVS